MGLTKSQYDAVMRVYDKRRISNHHIEEEHRRIAYEAIPELQELDRAVANSAAKRVRQLLSQNGIPILKEGKEKATLEDYYFQLIGAIW